MEVTRYIANTITYRMIYNQASVDIGKHIIIEYLDIGGEITEEDLRYVENKFNVTIELVRRS